MSGGWYCTFCGAVAARLPAGLVSCQRCGGLGLVGFDGARPKRVSCPVEGCEEQVWDDGSDTMTLQHRWQQHERKAVRV